MSTSQKKYILAIDHGTSGPKPALVSTTGEVLGWVFKDVPLILPKEGGAEQNPDDWWNGFLEGAKELIDKDLVPVEDIVGVCNTSQWSGTVPVDKDGKSKKREISLGDLKREIVKITPGQKIAYVADCCYSEKNVGRIMSLVEGADVFFCEAAFLEKDSARERSTV